MGFCPKCRTEYRPEFDKCSDCNQDLVDALPVEHINDQKPNLKLVTIATYSNMPEAELALNYLKNEGIECDIFCDNAGGWRNDLSFTRGIDIVVSEENVSQALKIIGSI